MDEKTVGILVFGLLTLVCWILIPIFYAIRKNLQKKFALQKQACSTVTNATIIKMVKRRMKKGETYSYCWFPTYEYFAGENRYETESSVGNRKKLFEEGQQTELHYNPNAPEEIWVPEEKADNLVPIFKIFLIGYGVASIFPLTMLILFILDIL